MVEEQPAQPCQPQAYWMVQTAEGSLVVDGEGHIVYANERAEQLFSPLNTERQSLIGHDIKEFWPSAPQQISFGQDSGPFPTHILTSDKQRIAICLWMAPLMAPYTQLFFTPQENTQKLQEALVQTHRLADIGTLASSVAHDLTTPIGIITATCSNLLHDVQDNALSTAQLLHYIHLIEQNAWRSVYMVDVLRNYALHHAPQEAVTDLNLILQEGIRLVASQFEHEFHVTIETDLDPHLKSLVCDHNQMTQVVVNLLMNAKDAMKTNGGKIWVRSWSFVPAEVLGEEFFAFCISDQGSGLAPELNDEVFKPFFTTKSSEKRAGLGLFIAKGIVTQHNGRIWAENNPNGGATFTVLLPRKR